MIVGTGLFQTGDYTANSQFIKTENACAARAAIFAKWAFGGVKAHLAKLQLEWKMYTAEILTA